MVIVSRQNETVKRLRRLNGRSARRESGLMLLEGEKLLFDALDSGIVPETILIAEGLTELERRITRRGFGFTSVSRDVINSISEMPNPQGIAASAYIPVPPSGSGYSDGMTVVLDAVQDPGNLGTIIRTADAMGASALLLGEGCCDPFSPKALRSAMGSTFHLPIRQEVKLTEELPRLQSEGFRLLCGHLRGAECIPEPGRRFVVVIGNEGNGISDEVAALCELYRLPMYGRAESLNAAVAAGIFMYELAAGLHGSASPSPSEG